VCQCWRKKVKSALLSYGNLRYYGADLPTSLLPLPPLITHLDLPRLSKPMNFPTALVHLSLTGSQYPSPFPALPSLTSLTVRTIPEKQTFASFPATLKILKLEFKKKKCLKPLPNLPASLTFLKIYGELSHPLTLPPTLLQMELSNFHAQQYGVTFPPSLTSLRLNATDTIIPSFPLTLRSLYLSKGFNLPLPPLPSLKHLEIYSETYPYPLSLPSSLLYLLISEQSMGSLTTPLPDTCCLEYLFQHLDE